MVRRRPLVIATVGGPGATAALALVPAATAASLPPRPLPLDVGLEELQSTGAEMDAAVGTGDRQDAGMARCGLCDSIGAPAIWSAALCAQTRAHARPRGCIYGRSAATHSPSAVQTPAALTAGVCGTLRSMLAVRTAKWPSA